MKYPVIGQINQYFIRKGILPLQIDASTLLISYEGEESSYTFIISFDSSSLILSLCIRHYIRIPRLSSGLLQFLFSLNNAEFFPTLVFKNKDRWIELVYRMPLEQGIVIPERQLEMLFENMISAADAFYPLINERIWGKAIRPAERFGIDNSDGLLN